MTFYNLLAIVAGLALVRLAVAVVRFVRLSLAAKRNYPAVLWYRWRWRRLALSMGLAHFDHYHKPVSVGAWLVSMLPFRTSVKIRGEDVTVKRLRWPRASFRADEYGLRVRVRCVPRAGRAEFEKVAPWIADAWRCHRVQIAQPDPGRLMLRGLRCDPLAEPFPMEAAPSGVYAAAAESCAAGQRIYLGRDEWGADRHIPLANVTSALVGGLPGVGKTTFANSLLCQLAPSRAVRLAIANGQGSSDFDVWRDRAYASVGDDRADAAELFEDVHAEMRGRFATVLERTGHRNAWRVGPTEAFPLYFLVVDEAQSFLDESMVKGDRQAEAHVRTCRAMLGQLVRRGRSVMMFTLILAHKPTTDSVPSFISANAGIRLCFAVQTIDAAVSVLGETIRQYPTSSPVTLQGPEGVGVLTAQLRTGADPYVRLRVPEISEEAAEVRARETARMLAEPQDAPSLVAS
jgi:S-DNA-T family DNA segregation ATPase FtsK/SpoIIIE